MGNVNWSRVLLGGFAAAIVFLAMDFLGMMVTGFDPEAWGTAHNLVQPPMWIFLAWDFALGIMAVWLYAAIRPRFGPGIRTAAMAAVFIWLMITFVYGSFTAMGLFEQGQFWKMAAWGFLQVFLATAVGGWLYREEVGDTTLRV